MRRTHRLAAAGELELEALRGDRFVIPAEDLNAGFNRRAAAALPRARFEPATLVASAIWDDAEWPAGEDVVTLATERVARHAAPHMATALLVPAVELPVELVWREDDDSPVLRSFLELATPEPARGS